MSARFFSEEQLIQLAPDPASFKAGRSLAAAGHWSNVGYSERAVWGEIQGSGREPYRTQADLLQPAFRCTCPSRKFPCKHGLGLLLMLANAPETARAADLEPPWVREWMDKRQTRAEEKPTLETTDKQARDRAKRQQERQRKVQDGVADLDRWLRDLVRTGLLSLPEKGRPFFDSPAARLVDAQAGGLAGMLREFGQLPFVGTAWQGQALERVARLHLLTEAFDRLDELPEPLREDVKNLIGWPRSPKELLADPRAEVLADDWLVLGHLTEKTDDLDVFRTYLLGRNSGRFALDLQFSVGNGAPETPWLPGREARAELAFFPSVWPLRAVLKSFGENHPPPPVPPLALADWSASQRQWAELLAQFPWADEVPQVVAGVQFIFKKNGSWLYDAAGRALPVQGGFSETKALHLLALSGGTPLPVALLRQGDTARPLGIWVNSRYCAV